MLKIAICDDDMDELENTYRMVLNLTEKHDEPDFNLRQFHSSFDLLKCIASGVCFDIYLLDIIMPVTDGIGVAEKIRESDEAAVIIYLTTSADYAVKSYRVSAFDYLIKPVGQKMLATVLEKAIDKIDAEKSKSFMVKTKDGITAVLYHRIMYAESIDRVVKFHLSDGSLLTSITMREPFDTLAEQLLQDRRFIRSHTSYVVNMRFVSAINSNSFMMVNDSSVPVARNKHTEIQNEYLDFLLRGGDNK